MSNKKVVVTIPAYNEENYIAEVVKKAKRYTEHVFVVDDASVDNTFQIAKEAGAVLFRHKNNSGYGGAIKSCFKIANEVMADILIIIDGDGQHDPKDIPFIIKPILKEEADIVIGSRFLTKNKVPLYRKFGIKVITCLFNIGAKSKISDSQSGFRVYNRTALDLIGPFYENSMGISVEIIIQARNRRLKIKELPINVKYHQDGSTLNPVIHGLSVAFNVIKIRAKQMI